MEKGLKPPEKVHVVPTPEMEFPMEIIV